MWYWAIGQAEFGEQIQTYGDTLWRQVGLPLLCSLAVLYVGLALTAFVIFLYGRSVAQKNTVGTGLSGTAQPGPSASLKGAASAGRGGSQAA